jgi:hypothetical protein
MPVLLGFLHVPAAVPAIPAQHVRPTVLRLPNHHPHVQQQTSRQYGLH